MREFIKYMSATIVGIIIFMVAMGVIGVIVFAGILASSQATTVVKENSVFALNLSGIVEERAGEDVIGQLTGDMGGSIGLDDILSSIKKAKENEDIKGIYIEAGVFSAGDPATAQAIRDQLADFRKSGKWIVAYGDAYTQTTYYICSVADKVFLNPQGLLDWHGMASEPMFFKDLLAKFGVKFQLVKVGKYKSAPETMTADKMSEPNREQVTAFNRGIWDKMVADVAQSRKLSKETLNQYADSMVLFSDPSEIMKKGLVDKLLYTDEVKGEIKEMLKIDEDETINQLSLTDMIYIPERETTGDQIAVYYAYGDIVDSNPGGIYSSACIDAQKVTKDLERLKDDSDVKAVVIRINSGGGSAYASEQIWRAVGELRKEKPVVVSMGGYAASGGYYMSCCANYIYAEPTTLTGSIGIFGMFPDFSQMLTEKLGVKFDVVKTNKFSDFGSLSRPFNDEEIALLEDYIDRGYALFIRRVADGRGMKTEQVEEIAQGRVWLGQDALKIKLVDAMGGIDKAIAKAAELAKTGDYHTEAYPAMPGWMDQLMETATGSGGNYLDEQMRSSLGDYYTPISLIKNIDKHNAIQARMPYMVVMK